MAIAPAESRTRPLSRVARRTREMLGGIRRCFMHAPVADATLIRRFVQDPRDRSPRSGENASRNETSNSSVWPIRTAPRIAMRIARDQLRRH